MDGKNSALPKGIYLEFKKAPGHKYDGKLHAYLVYRDGAGGAEVIRGGPDERLSIFGDISET